MGVGHVLHSQSQGDALYGNFDFLMHANPTQLDVA